MPAALLRLWIEFAVLFVGVPVLMAVFFGRYPLFPTLLGLTLGAAALLSITPGFRWRELLRSPVKADWVIFWSFTSIAAVSAVTITLAVVPERFLMLPRERPGLWLMIVVLYPLVSALPQELIFRPLFFRRYGPLFPRPSVAIAANAAVFGFGHLFYMNWIAITLTAGGGAIIAWAYTRHQSFLLAWGLHAVGGIIVFTVGLGVFFFHRMIGQTP